MRPSTSLACTAVLVLASIALAVPAQARASALADETALARGTRRSSASSSSPRSAGRASRTSRWTSTRSSASRPSRCAGPGRRRPRQGRADRRDLVRPATSTTSTFPGNALDPGCGYERWARRITEGKQPTAYAHVATDPGSRQARAPVLVLLRVQRLQQPARGRLGDDPARLRRARRARGARAADPVEVGYSSHEGAERADWGDDKLELVDGTHPVVYPAAGSHANKFTEALYLGSSAQAGVGCDDTRGPARRAAPGRQDDPERPGSRRAASRGSRSRAAGASCSRRSSTARPAPTSRSSGREPIEWSEGWRDRELRGADRRRARHRRHRLLLHRRRAPARMARQAAPEPRR